MADKFWATQSPVTDPGKALAAVDELANCDLKSLRHIGSQLMFHYRGGDFAKHRVPTARRSEIQLCYAEDLLHVVLSRGESSLARDRQPIDRVVGCCRDATILFLTMARHKGFIARARVGFATYFDRNWFLDHVVAEVWDENDQRWRLVDPQMEDGDKVEVNGKIVDWFDITEDEFLTGPAAWQAVRAGKADPEKFVVSPELGLPMTRGWPQLANNVIKDLAFLNKQETLLWEDWGMLLNFMGGPLPEADSAFLDEISATAVQHDLSPEDIAKLMSRPGLKIPETVTRFDPNGGPPQGVSVKRLLGMQV
jgi:hypothetical protein